MKRISIDHLSAFAFFSRVRKTKSCWEWRGQRHANGYGRFKFNGIEIRAHWFLLENDPEEGIDACHVCDNPCCVNPNHIFLGTREDNMQDAASKLRTCHGEKNPCSVLTSQQIHYIRKQKRYWGLGRKLAKELGVSDAIISDVLNKKSWKHI